MMFKKKDYENVKDWRRAGRYNPDPGSEQDSGKSNTAQIL